MRTQTKVLVCLLVVAWLLVQPSLAEGISKGVLQLPDMCTGWDLQSQWDPIDSDPNTVRADNWRCPDGRLVTDVHWWGSYYLNTDGGNPVDQFEISIHASEAVQYLPGTLLLRETFTLSEVNETFWGVDANGEEVFEYTADLTNPFCQTEGEIYWLAIVAITEGQVTWPQWGWHSAVTAGLDELLGSAQTAKDPSVLDPTFGGNKVITPWQEQAYDMAFELTTIPEPAAVCLVGGLLLPLVLRKRLR
jgi:hypothetical protein